MARVRNRERLMRKLKALPEAVKADIRVALERSADEIVALAKSLVPVDKGALRDSIGWTYGEAPKGSMALATGGSGDLKVTVYAGSSDAFYARWVEFGTVNMSGIPFFFPAYRALRRRVRSRVSRAVTKAARRVAGGGA